MEEQEQKVEKQEVEEKKPEEQEKQEEEKQEETEYKDLILEIQQEYMAKIQSIVEKNKKELAKRDNLIKQLIAGEKDEETPSIADKINARRQFKKW